jgi:urease accessory protein
VAVRISKIDVKRAIKVTPAGGWSSHAAIDCVVLDAEDRHRRRIALTGQNGTRFLLDLESPVALRDGDGLVLDDGSIVAVRGTAEPLIEIAGARPRDLLRFAWHIGNRHTGLQITGDRLRLRRDHVLEAMLQKMGATLTVVDAPFDPEPGAPAETANHHGG